MRYISIFLILLSLSFGGNKVKVILNSGEFFLGTIDNAYIVLNTDYGTLKINSEKIFSIKIKGQEAEVFFDTGHLSGELDLNEIVVKSIFGNLNIPISTISEIYLLNYIKFDNFDFELGFKGWKRIGSGHQIERFVSDYKKAYQGNSSYQTCPGNTPIPYGIDSLTNELISDEFLLSRDKTKFSAYVFGGGNRDLLYVGLFSAADDKEICRLYKSYNGANWQYVEKLLYLTKDKLVYIKIVDHAQTRWGHIAVDQIEIK